MRPIHTLSTKTYSASPIFGNQIRVLLVGTVCLAMMMAVPHAMAAKPVRQNAEAINPMKSLMVPVAEYDEIERQALDGSADAALQLERQYGLTMQYTEEIFWGSIAAENGSQVGAYNLGFTLAGSPDPKQRRRALFWLKKAKAGGGETGKLAADFLTELEERERTNKVVPAVLPERYPKW